MAIFGNFKGTTQSEFQIGKTDSGTKISTGTQPSSDISNGDIYIDSSNSTLQVYNNAWVSVGSTLKDLNVDSGTLFVDSSNDTVSVGSTASNDKLFVNGSLRLGTNPTLKFSGAYLDVAHSNGTATQLRVRDNGSGSDPIFKIYDANNTSEVFKVQGRTVTFTDQEFTNSNIMKFNQMYTGASTGSYFTNGEYQKVVTIIPDGTSQNYQVVGRITAQNAGETHTVYFNTALRSGETLPDLSWSTSYEEEYNGSRYIDPQLWTKETTTAGFIFAFKTLGTIYGTVTVDMEVIPRNSSQKDNVTVNAVQNSEQSAVETGYTINDMVKGGLSKVSNNIIINGEVSSHIIPSANVTYDLGTDTARWRDLYLSGSTIKLGTTAISVTSDNEIDFSDSANTSIKRKLVVDEIEIGSGDDKVILRKGSDGKLKSVSKNRSTKEETSNKVDLDDNDTDDLSEGSTNKYYTTERANTAIDAKLAGDLTFGNATVSGTTSSGVVEGVVFQPITDYGLITANTTISIDYGSVRESGTVPAIGDFEYVSDIFGPTGDSFVVASLPSAAQPGQMIYVSDETGGSVMAFSDGSNWRRITDRAVVS
jgi:hypothetical protein